MTARQAPGAPADVETSAIRKITWRFLPIIIGAYFIAYIDRVNIGMVKHEMAPDIGMSDIQFGLASGLIFIGLIFFEVPSNKLALKWTPRVWIPRIMVTWGIVVILNAFIQHTSQLYALRIALGLAEAGMAPAVFLYLAQWFPGRHRAKALSAFYLSLPLAMAVGSPLTGWILEFSHNWFGMAGWRWVFIIQGAAAIVVALPVFLLLAKKPGEASWLSDAERTWLKAELDAEDRAKAQHAPPTFWRSIIDSRVLVLGVVYLLLGYGVNALVYWLPSIVDAATPGMSSLQLGVVSALPFIVAAIGIYAVGVAAHRTQARLWNMLVPALIGVAGFAGAAMFMDSPTPALIMIAVSLA
ncbi:MAG: MFS transporter, partial [Stackebrandtia sp.]